MTSAKENELMTLSSPGSAAGSLLRQYWQPAALVEELDTSRPLVPVKLLGEELVLFRDLRHRAYPCKERNGSGATVNGAKALARQRDPL
jgi:hypothetical protein